MPKEIKEKKLKTVKKTPATKARATRLPAEASAKVADTSTALTVDVYGLDGKVSGSMTLPCDLLIF